MTLSQSGALLGIGNPDEGHMAPLPQGALITNSAGIEMITSTLLKKAPPIIALPLGDKKLSKKTIQTTWDNLPWQGPDKARYAIASHGANNAHIAIIFDLENEAKELIVRIGNSGPELDPSVKKLSIIRNRVPSLKSHNEGWRMKSYQRLSNGPQGSWRGVVVLSPPLLMDPLRRPEVFITTDLEPSNGAWWLRRLWRPIQSKQAQP